MLSLAGLASVLMAIVTSFGLCTATGLFVCPLHNFVPFLMLGLGVDDIFVIVRAYNFHVLKVGSDQKVRRGPNQGQLVQLSIQDRMAITMKNSGVAITVTSLTNVIAFAIGGTSVRSI